MRRWCCQRCSKIPLFQPRRHNNTSATLLRLFLRASMRMVSASITLLRPFNDSLVHQFVTSSTVQCRPVFSGDKCGAEHATVDRQVHRVPNDASEVITAATWYLEFKFVNYVPVSSKGIRTVSGPPAAPYINQFNKKRVVGQIPRRLATLPLRRQSPTVKTQPHS